MSMHLKDLQTFLARLIQAAEKGDWLECCRWQAAIQRTVQQILWPVWLDDYPWVYLNDNLKKLSGTVLDGGDSRFGWIKEQGVLSQYWVKVILIKLGYL